VLDVIMNDHRELEIYYNNCLSTPDQDTKVRWQNQLVWKLARHSIGEELVIYPALEFHLPTPRGQEMADKDRESHHTIKEMLSDSKI
ncbi:hypothetical protein BDD12DRAFT_750961, partial [Trichophaea hybrida]